MKIKLSIILIIAASLNLMAQENAVKWYTIQEAEVLMKQAPKPLFIDAYTDWCGWCKKMDKDTFTNPVIAGILNSNYYPVKFNAESSEKITFLGQEFINDGTAGKAHQLAVALLRGQLSYPTVVFMTTDSKGQLGASAVPGYKTPVEMEVLLNYFAAKAYEKQTWEDFQKSFKGKVTE